MICEYFKEVRENYDCNLLKIAIAIRNVTAKRLKITVIIRKMTEKC